jgi:hypothetical protein
MIILINNNYNNNVCNEKEWIGNSRFFDFFLFTFIEDVVLLTL